MTNFEPKNKPTKARERVAWWLVGLAKRIHPDSEAVTSFHLGIMHDYLIEGQVAVRVDPGKLYND